MDINQVMEIAITVVVLLISFMGHEVAHGYAAYLLGDPTAKMSGRLTFNPFKHLDLFGTLAFIITRRIGWAKPVPFNPNYFKNPKSGTAITAIAGPLSNFMMAVLCAVIYKVSILAVYGGNVGEAINAINQNGFAFLAFLFVYSFIISNMALMLFNLLPIPPLDGSKVFMMFLPDRIGNMIYKYDRIIMVLFIALIWTTNITRYLSYPIDALTNWFFVYIIGLPL